MLAFLSRFRLCLFVVCVFFAVSSTLAFLRMGTRGISLFTYLRPNYRPFTQPSHTGNVARPFRAPPQAPPSFIATPASLIADAKALCDQTRKLLDRIVDEVSPETATFRTVLQPIAEHEDTASLSNRIIGFYQAVSTNAQLRDASSKAKELMGNAKIEASMREDMFKLVDAVYRKGEKLPPESQRLLEKERKSYIQNGLGIPAGPQRRRFKEIKEKLSSIAIEFEKNLNEENGGVWFTRQELNGLSEGALGSLEQGAGENEGKMKLSFQYPDYYPGMKLALHSETRKRLFIGNENRCNSNVPLFEEAIVLRDEAARLLGYPNHAAFRLEDKMAKDPETVNNFLQDLKAQITPIRNEEIEHLKEIKRDNLQTSSLDAIDDGRYYLWDHRFYNRIMVEKEFSIDEQEIAEYFPLQSTIKGMLTIFEELFGLVFIEITGERRTRLAGMAEESISKFIISRNTSFMKTGKEEDLTWHEDVQLFAVWDDDEEGGSFVGYLYLDLHPRQGKFGHAANFSLQPGYSNKIRRYPATALVCNFSKPTPTKPSLLKHDEMVILFHELGHGIHDLVSRTTYSRFHGTAVVEDFVEAPSQMLENWCWTPSQLKRLSQHYQTRKPIPDELIAKQISTKHVNDAIFNLRQLHFGIYDMVVHTPSSHLVAGSLNLSILYNELRTQITGLNGPEDLGMGSDWGNGQATIGHLMSGYDAGYYGYLSSQVYSADMFYSVFQNNVMDGKEGRRYRHMILEKGGSQDELKTLVDFLGREPSTDAFYKDLGLKNKR